MEISEEDKLAIRQYICMCQIKSNTEQVVKTDEESDCFTPSNLEMTIRKGDEDIVMFLLQNGAYFLSNKDEKAAMSLAIETKTSFGKQIAKVLGKQSIPATHKTIQSSCELIEPEIKPQNNKNLSRAVSVQEIPYPKRAGTSGVSGQFYETKLLSLVVHRALHDKDIREFYLAANIADIGEFDDVCFRYENVACFMQTKHRENPDKARLTVASVRSTTGKLGLGIYYDSFLKIKNKFSQNSTDPMFKGTFESIDSYFILYTPLKESFERKLSGSKTVCNKLNDIIITNINNDNKSKITDIFQFDYEVRDIDFLTSYIKHEQMKNLGKTFLDFIMSKNKIEVMMTDELIKVYHPALAQEVVLITRTLDTTPIPPKHLNNSKAQNNSQTLHNPNVPMYVHKAIFRPEFFASVNENIITLKKTFFKEIVYNHSTKIELSKDEVKRKLKEISTNPSAQTISTLIGSPIKFDDNNDKLILDITKLPKNKYKNEEIQQIRYDLQKIQVTREMVRDAVYLAGQRKLMALDPFRLPLSFGNVDLTISKKTKKDVEDRLDFLVEKFYSLILHFSERNKNKEIKIIDISDDIVGPKKLLEISHLNSNGGIGGAIGNLLKFDTDSEQFTFNTSGELKENAIYILNNLKKKTNEDLAKYRFNVIVSGLPRVSFDIYKFDKIIAAEFFRKLWFYTNQAQEEAVESVIKDEINKYYNADKQRHQLLFHVHSDAIFLRFHDEIQKWWKKLTSFYLTKSTNIYEKAKKEIMDSPLLTVLKIMFNREIKQLGIEFNENALNYFSFNEFIEKDKNILLNIVSNAVVLSAAKIMQRVTFQSSYTFVNLDYVHILPQADYETMMEELAEIKDTTLVLFSETRLDLGLKDTLQKILSSYIQPLDNLKRQVIMITCEPFEFDQLPILHNFSCCTEKDDNVNLIDLTLESQTFILDKYTIIYQGQEVKLNTIIDETSKELINSKLLRSIISKDRIEIGHSLSTQKYEEVKNYYIHRNLKQGSDEYEVNTLNDIDEKIVLISAKPCMGKTILLTHLSLETKIIDPKLWIVRINMSAHDKKLEILNNKNEANVMIFLCKAALKTPDDIKKVAFIKVDNKTIAINSNDCEDISFELEFFIHCYNSGNVIFLFDSFDQIYPQNTDEGLRLFTTLKKADKRMWITSNCYVISILETKFGSSYKLDQLSTIQQKSFLQKFWSTNLKLEKLNHDQFNNMTIFINYILRVFNREIKFNEDVNGRPIMPLFSVPLHILYLTLLDHFKHEARSISPHYLRNKIKREWHLDSFTAVDRYLGRSDEDEALGLAGTPLHMYIAANYFAFQVTDKFDLRLDTKMISDRSNVYINAVTLYERFLKDNMKNICEIENKNKVGNEQEKLRDNFFDSHKKLALYAICKESDISIFLTQPEIREVKETIKKIESGEIKSPLIDSVVDGVPRFYHLLFAEYFVVECLSELLNRMKNNDFDNVKLESLWDFIVNIVLVTSPQSLRNAFEYKLKYDPHLAEVTNNDKCKKIIFNLLVKQNPSTSTQAHNTDNALNIAVNEGLVHVTNFLLRGIRGNVDDENVEKIMTIFKSSANILAAADSSRSILSDDLLRCIQNVDGETIIAVLNSNDLGKSIHDSIKVKLVEPVKLLTNKVVEFSGNNENLVRLVEEIPRHLVDFIRQLNQNN